MTDYGPGVGLNYMDPESGRCARCDSRYCVEGCHAGTPGYVYANGHGWVTFTQAAHIENLWTTLGLICGEDFGPTHPFRRIDWEDATPDDDEIRDSIRLTHLQPA